MLTTDLEDLHLTWESSMKEGDKDKYIHKVLLDYYTNDDGTVDIESSGQLNLK